MSYIRRISELIEEMRREMRRLMEDLERAFELDRPMWDYESRSLEPLCTISENEKEVIVTFDLPLVDKDSIEVNATEDTLEVSAKLRQAFEYRGIACLERGVHFTCFRKVIRLPSRVDPTRARARFRNGILEVRLPKRVKGRRITIE